jgi:hypothetical protein
MMTMKLPDASSSSVLILSAPVVEKLSTSCNEGRLPPTYVGSRRIRPSSALVRQVWRQQNVNARGNSPLVPEGENVQSVKNTTVTYKIVDPVTAIERRMTSEEKKLQRLAHLQEKKKQKQLRKGQQANLPPGTTGSKRSISRLSDVQDSHRYYNLPINDESIAEELADLQGNNDCVPPVVLGPAAAMQAFRCGALMDTQPASDHGLSIVVNDSLARQWAECLVDQVMAPTEHSRQQESALRPMPYQVVPEVWQRLRPASLITGGVAVADSQPQPELDATTVSDPIVEISAAEKSEWISCTVRPPCPPFDATSEAIVRVLHAAGLHVSCGSKFGADFLLYDGPRQARHAFAGLRVYSGDPISAAIAKDAGDLSHGAESGKDESVAHDAQLPWPLPGAHDVAGYVRCLNTAGKLALVATAINMGPSIDVVFLDLALQKVPDASGRSKRSRGGKSIEDRIRKLAKT